MEFSVTQSFFSSCCNLLVLLGRISGISFFFKKFRAFSLSHNLKHGCYGCLDILSRSLSRELGHHHVRNGMMNTPKCAKKLFQNVDINASFHCYIFRKKVQTIPDQISTENSPHHYTARVFCGFNRKF